MTAFEEESDLRARASSNARDLVDKLQQQRAELENDPRFTAGAAFARAAAEAAQRILHSLSKPPTPLDRDTA